MNKSPTVTFYRFVFDTPPPIVEASQICQLSWYCREIHGFDCFLPIAIHFLPVDFCKIKSYFFGYFRTIVWFTFDFMHVRTHLSMNVLMLRITMKVLFMIFVVIYYPSTIFSIIFIDLAKFGLSPGLWSNLPVFLKEKTRISRFRKF